MNELIERLAREAGITPRTNPTAMEYGLQQCNEAQLEAFAKAVAREAAGIAELCDDTDHAYRMILARFGITSTPDSSEATKP